MFLTPDDLHVLTEPFEAIAARKIAYNDRSIPNAQGIYFLFDGDALAYIGMSNNIQYRLFQHRYPNKEIVHNTNGRAMLKAADWWTHASWCVIEERSRDDVHEVEVYYIRLLKPPRNVKYI